MRKRVSSGWASYRALGDVPFQCWASLRDLGWGDRFRAVSEGPVGRKKRPHRALEWIRMRAQRTGIDGTPAWALDAELWLTGAGLISDPEAVRTASTLVSPEDFYDHTNAHVWRATVAIANAGKEPSVATVGYYLIEAGLLDQVGTETRLVDLASDPMTFLYADASWMCAHARLVRTAGERRRAATEQLQEAQRMARAAGDVMRGKVKRFPGKFQGGVTLEYDVAD